MKFLLALPLFYYLARAQAQETQCFWPDRTATSTGSDTFLSCSSSNSPSQCCKRGDACLSNGLCMGGSTGLPYRGGCTDASFSNKTACPTWCSGPLPNNLASIYRCKPNSDGLWKVWCDDGAVNWDLCETAPTSTFFDYESGEITGIAGEKIESGDGAGLGGKACNETGSPAAGTKDTGICEKKGESVKPLAVGLGVGLPLLVLSCITGFLLWSERRKRLQSEKALSVASSAGPMVNAGGSKPKGADVYTYRKDLANEVPGNGQSAEMPGNGHGTAWELDSGNTR